MYAGRSVARGPNACHLRILGKAGLILRDAACAGIILMDHDKLTREDKHMPTISMFYGIIIRLYFAPGEHNPPHFHAFYNEFKASVDIRTGEIIEGALPPRQRKLIQAWAELHQEELMADWSLVMNGDEPFKIPPLQ